MNSCNKRIAPNESIVMLTWKQNQCSRVETTILDLHGYFFSLVSYMLMYKTTLRMS